MSNSEFKVNTGPALAGLKELVAVIKRTGSELDGLEKSAQKVLNPARTNIDRYEKQLETVIASASKLGKKNAETARTLTALQHASNSAFQEIEANYLRANRAAAVFQKGQEELRSLVTQTDHLNNLAKSYRNIAAMQDNAANKARELVKATEVLSTEEGKALVQARALHEGTLKRASAESRLTQQIRTQQQALQMLNSEDGKAKIALDERIRSDRAVAASSDRLKSQVRELTAQKKLATTEDYRRVQALKNEAAAQAIQEQASRKAVTYLRQQEAATAALRREQEFLNSAAGREQVMLRQQLAETRREMVKTADAQTRTHKNLRLTNQLTTALRAGLHGAQASIGMYTSSTIAAAVATFSLARAMRSTMQIGIEYTSTMARTNAIMDTSSTMFGTVQSQVRLLGQTTQFTASQVADAMTELGQAGLSAGQSIMALQPTLDLAAIGNISMASSADHATNIMTAFGKEASDLTHIVNLMATATTSSNTTIDQLANALSYAGPAAHSAGYAIEETVAAISTLANSGIKSSRAGTAMRRLFVSLVNPTEKGRKVLEKYNIAVEDLDGSFLSLQNVLNQFSRAFEGKENERLGAIQDLVGVYATSPIAALVENTADFNAQIAQFDAMGDAAERMKKKITDGLEFDVREVKSAFQELQLTVFEDNEMQFRIWAQELSAFLQYLTTTGESGTTILQEFGTTVKNTTSALLLMYAAAKSYNLGQFFGGRFRDAARDLGVLRESASRLFTVLGASAGSKGLGTLTIGAAALNAEIGKTVKSVDTLGNVAGSTATSIAGKMGAAAGSFLRFAGPVGAAISTGYMLYEAYKLVFGDRSEVMQGMEDVKYLTDAQSEALRLQEEKVANLKTRYEELTAARDRRKGAAEAVVFNKQIEELNKEVQSLEARKSVIQSEMEVMGAGSSHYARYESHLLLVENKLEQQIKTRDFLANKVGEAIGPQQELNALLAEEAKILRNMQAVTSAEGAAKVNEELTEVRNRIEEIEKVMQGASEEFKAFAVAGEFVNRNISETLAKYNQKKVSDDQLFRESVAAKEKAIKDYVDVMAIAAESGAKAFDGVANMEEAIRNAATALANAFENNMSLFSKFSERRDTFTESYDSYMFSKLPEQERLEAHQKKRTELQKELSGVVSGMGSDASASPERGSELLEQLKKEETAIEAITRSQEKLNKSTERTAKATRDLYSVYEGLYRQYDKVGYSADNLAKTSADLNTLLSQGRISQEQFNLALAEAQRAHAKVALEEDKRYKLLKDLSNTYLSTSMDKQVTDLTRLANSTELLTEAERKLFEQRILKGVREEGAGVPSIGTSYGPEGPFSGLLSTAASVSEGQAELAKRGEAGRDNQANAIYAAQIELRQALQSEDIETRLEAERKYAAEVNNINQIANEKSAQLADDMVAHRKQASMLTMAGMAESMAGILGMVADAGEDATAAQKVAFAAQKALTVASILLYTHAAASKAMADPSEPTIFGSIALSTAIMAQGYASAGMVAGMAIGELSGRDSSSYAGAFDNGGYIPAGQFGLVGEIGPEIVTGPANVTSRKETAALLNKGSSGPQEVTIAPVINVHHESSGSSNSEQDGKMMGNAIKMVVMEMLQKELRPNGLLYRR